jgi:IS605 OrfB family transposase
MLRTSKHNISDITNINKLKELDNLFKEYEICLNSYINLIILGTLPLKMKMSSKLLPTLNIKHSKWKRDIYIKASEIIRSQTKKSNDKRFKRYKSIYKYFLDKHPNSKFVNTKFNDLKLKNIIKTKYFTKPDIEKISINLTNEFYDIKNGNKFDNFIRIKLPFFNEKGTRSLSVNIPLKHHRHSKKMLNNNFKLRNNIQLKKVDDKYYINLIWEREQILKPDGKSIGIDMGYKKLITLNDGTILGKELYQVYQKISNKVQGSKNFKKSLAQRDNLINYYINLLNVEGVNKIIIEDLNNVKHESKLSKSVNNKLQRWSYRKTIDKLNSICEVNGIELVKVSPRYTSQACSSCGNIDKKSRNGENYQCLSCGYSEDADINAAINIYNKGVYSPFN